MNIKFVLRDEEKKDGTQTIRCYIQHNGRAYFNTKYSVLLRDFKGGMVKSDRVNSVLINSALIRMRNEVEALCYKHPSLPAKDIAKFIGKGSAGAFLDYFDGYIKNCKSGSIKRAQSTIDKYDEILNALKLFEYTTDFNTLDKKWYDAYTGKMRQSGCNENTIGNHIKFIKSIMRQAFEDGVSSNLEYQKKYFKTTSQETDGISLSPEEINLWLTSDKIDPFPYLQEERDRFLISYYLIMSFADTMLIDKSKFITEDGKVYFKSNRIKTGTEFVVPVKPIAYDILKKYDFKFSKISNQKANEKLKEIGMLLEIKEPFTLLGKVKPRYKFITTHTGRRTGATHLYDQGVDEKIICHLGGWTKVDTMRHYIKRTRTESAKKASEFEFFK